MSLEVIDGTPTEISRWLREHKRIEIKCPYCGYGGEDLKIGRKPICREMMCSKCKRYFYPFAFDELKDKKEEIER